MEESRTPLVVFEPGAPTARIAPTSPLGPWALVPLERLLRATASDQVLTLDLEQAPISEPAHVAAVLWADDVAGELGVALEVVVPDMVSAELLDFAGVRAPVYAPGERPLSDARFRRVSAY